MLIPGVVVLLLSIVGGTSNGVAQNRAKPLRASTTDRRFAASQLGRDDRLICSTTAVLTPRATCESQFVASSLVTRLGAGTGTRTPGLLITSNLELSGVLTRATVYGTESPGAEAAELSAEPRQATTPRRGPAEFRRRPAELRPTCGPTLTRIERATELRAGFADYDLVLLRRALLGEAESGSAGRDLLADAINAPRTSVADNRSVGTPLQSDLAVEMTRDGGFNSFPWRSRGADPRRRGAARASARVRRPRVV